MTWRSFKADLLAALKADNENGELDDAIEYVRRRSTRLDTPSAGAAIVPEKLKLHVIEYETEGTIGELLERYRALADYLDAGSWTTLLTIVAANGLSLAHFNVFTTTAALAVTAKDHTWFADLINDPVYG